MTYLFVCSTRVIGSSDRDNRSYVANIIFNIKVIYKPDFSRRKGRCTLLLYTKTLFSLKDILELPSV